MGHTNDIECMHVHPGTLALVATGQAEGHDHVNCSIQKPHIQVLFALKLWPTNMFLLLLMKIYLNSIGKLYIRVSLTLFHSFF